MRSVSEAQWAATELTGVLADKMVNEYAVLMIASSDLNALRAAQGDEITPLSSEQQGIIQQREQTESCVYGMKENISVASSLSEISRIAEQGVADLARDNPAAMKFAEEFVNKIRELTGIKPAEKGVEQPQRGR